VTPSSLLLVFTIFYQTQSYHPIIPDSDLMKNFPGFILALNDTVHLCSTYALGHYQYRVGYIQWLGISHRQIRFLGLFSTVPILHTHLTVTNCTVFLLYGITALFIVFLLYHCTFYCIVLWHMYRPRLLCIFSNSAIQLFSFKYVNIHSFIVHETDV